MDIPLLETPQSLFVINKDLIADQQAFRLDQVLQNDASVQKQTNFLGAYSSYQIRGFNLNNASNYLRDGRTHFHWSPPPVEVLERIEILKGPSSVLYGTMAPGGLINMLSKRPTLERYTSFKTTVGTDSLMHFHIDHGGPASNDGSIRYRINGVYEDSESFREYANGKVFSTERSTVAATVEWDLAPQTQFRINADATNDNRPQDLGLVNLTGNFSKQSYDLIYSQPWTHYNVDVWNIHVELSHRFSESLQLKSGYSLQDFKRDRFDNQAAGELEANGNLRIRARRRINQQKYGTAYVDINGQFSTGSFEHQYLLGLERTLTDSISNETSRNESFTINIYHPEILPNPHIPTRPEDRLGGTDRCGIYFQDMISIDESWRILIGGRYDDYQTDSTNESGAGVFDYSVDEFTPRLGVLYYFPGIQLSSYASFSRSFEPNAPVGAEYANSGQALEPTLGEMYELGAKWEIVGGRLLLTAAVFIIDRENSPIENLLTQRIEQQGLQRHEGFEFSVQGLVGEHLRLSGSATYLDAQFKQDDDPAIVGNTPSGVPEWAFRAHLNIWRI
ncbi:MAG: TonB-dependent siderophore receptor [Parahaliea sp.]